MPDVTRAKTSDADWFEADDLPATDPGNYTVDKGRDALADLTEDLNALNYTLASADTKLADATQYLADLLSVQGMVEIVATIQDLRRKLGVAEAFVSRAAGQLAAEYSGAKGQLPDGRPYEIMRGAKRTKWDHEGWQAAVRKDILTPIGVLEVPKVNLDTGEVEGNVHLNDLLVYAQSVHGSTPPRVRALRDHDIDPGDYCETSPGPFSVKIVQD